MKHFVSRSIITAAVLCWTGCLAADAQTWKPAPHQKNATQAYSEYKPNSDQQRDYRAAPVQNVQTPQPKANPVKPVNEDQDDEDLFSDNDADYYEEDVADDDDLDDSDDNGDVANNGQQSNAEAFKQLFNTLRTLQVKGDSLTLKYETVDGKTFELDLPNIDTDLKIEHTNGNHVVRGTVDAQMNTELESKTDDTVKNNSNLHAEGSVAFSSWESLERLQENFFAPGDAHFALDITQLTWKSDYGTYAGKGLLSFDRKETTSTINYVEDTTLEITSKYDDFLRAYVKKQILESNRQDLKDQAEDWLDLVPKPSTWGEIKNDHNYEIVFNLGQQGDVKNGLVDIKKSRMTIGSYGFDWTLNLKANNNFQEYNLNSHVELFKYKQLLEELGDYANRWITTSNKYATEPEKMPLLDEQVKAEIVDLFKKLSKDPNSDAQDWVTDIHFDQAQGLKIGQLNGEQARAELMKVWERLSAKFNKQPPQPQPRPVVPPQQPVQPR